MLGALPHVTTGAVFDTTAAAVAFVAMTLVTTKILVRLGTIRAFDVGATTGSGAGGGATGGAGLPHPVSQAANRARKGNRSCWLHQALMSWASIGRSSFL